MAKLSTYLIGVLLAIAFASTAAATIYRWVDSDGLVHYGDRPPPGAKTELIRPEQRGFSSYPASPAAEEEDVGGENIAGEDEAEAGSVDVNDPERTARIRREQCARARERLENYSQAARMQLRQEDGSVRDMTPEERVQAISRAEADVSQLCREQE